MDESDTNNLREIYAEAQRKHAQKFKMRPNFKDKFRPGDAKKAIEKLLPDIVSKYQSMDPNAKQKRGRRGQAAAVQNEEENEDSDDEEGGNSNDWRSQMANEISA